MDSDSIFLESLAQVADSLPSEVIVAAVALLRKMPSAPTTEVHHSLLQLATQPSAKRQLAQLCKHWQTDVPHLTPTEVAACLQSAAYMAQRQAQRQQVELVWTGPSPLESSLRRTDQALFYLINHAVHSLWIVTFAAYRVKSLVTALEAAAERGVAINFVAESSEESGGNMAWGAIEAIGGHLPKQTSMYIWPQEQRPANETGQRGSLHAKCAVADQQIALVSSANLTEHALNLNMELGLLISGAEVATAIVEHFQRLAASGVLRRLT